MEQVVDEVNLERALRAVKRKRGAAGIDKMTTAELEPHFRRHGAEMRAKLVPARRGAWRLAANGLLQTALSNATLRRYGFVMPSDLAAGS